MTNSTTMFMNLMLYFALDDDLESKDLHEYFNAIMNDMKNALNLFKSGKGIFTPENLEHELVIFNKKNKRSTINSNLNDNIESDYIACPSDGILHLSHRFESVAHIPISKQNFIIKVYEQYEGYNFRGGKELKYREVTDKNINSKFDNNGYAKIDMSNLKGYFFKIFINPKSKTEREDDLDKLYQSYENIHKKLIIWLNNEIETTQRTKMETYVENNSLVQFNDIQRNSALGTFDFTVSIFESISSAIVSVFSGEAFDSFENLDENGKEILEKLGPYKEKASYVISDEIISFLFYYAITLYILTLTPGQQTRQLYRIGTEFMTMFYGGALLKLLDATITISDVVNAVNTLDYITKGENNGTKSKD